MNNRKIIKLLNEYPDIKFFEVKTKTNSCLCLYVYTLIDLMFLETLIPKIEQYIDNKEINFANKIDISFEDINRYIYDGYLIIISNKKTEAINIASLPTRNPETSPQELTLVGAKDGFIEDIETNISLLRKRVNSKDLKLKYFKKGTLNETKIALLYMENIIDEKVLIDINKKIDDLDVETIYNVGQFQSELYKNKGIFPSINYTTRVDLAYESLFTGRYIIFVDNIPLALIAPINLTFFTNFSDTNNEHYLVGLFERLLQSIALILGIFLSGFTISIFSFNPEFLPYITLANFLSARKGITFSIVTEMIISDILFQLFRIAGTRSLSGLNQALLIMGSIIIGQIAISSGILTQHVVIISAISIISPYLVSNSLSFNNSINFLRIIIFVASCFFGFLGFSISSLIVIIFILSINSGNVSFAVPFSPSIPKKFKDFLFPKSYPKKKSTINKGVKK